MNNTQPQQPQGPESEPTTRSPAKMTHDEIVRRMAVDVRCADHKSRLRSDQCRALRASAEKVAERIESLDWVSQQVVIGLTAQRGGIPDGAMLDGFIDEARLVSQTLRAPLGPWRDSYGRDQGERPPRMAELVRTLMVRSRCQMDPKTRLAAPGCNSLRDRCQKLAESILDLDVEIQDVILEFCVRGGIADGGQLQTYIDQARLLVQSLHETFPPPLPPPHQH